MLRAKSPGASSAPPGLDTSGDRKAVSLDLAERSPVERLEVHRGHEQEELEARMLMQRGERRPQQPVVGPRCP